MKRTVFYEYHLKAGANFSEFGGYEMPLWYSSAKQEHLSVLKNIGLFDTSHMSVFTITGDGAIKLLKMAFTRDLENTKCGKSVYGLFIKDDKTVIDDTVIYKIATNKFMVVVNAGMFETVSNFLSEFNVSNYEIVNYCDKLGKIDIQGPKSLALMENIFGPDLFDKFPYFSFKGSLEDVLISRSGYTGEFGFEIYINRDKAIDMWNRLLKDGALYGITTCGLAARDSLRVGAVLPLSHQDIGNWEFCNTPWDFAQDHPNKNKKSYTYPYAGFDVRKLKESNGKVLLNEESIGRVLSCVSEVSLTRIDNKVLSVNSPELPVDTKIRGLVAGFILVDRKLDFGQVIDITDGHRTLKVEIVENIRPDRTARKSLENIRRMYE